MKPLSATHVVGFGGGCHWCTEAVFQSLRGVRHVAQGWIASEPPDDAFSEAVLVDFDPEAIALRDLIDVHLTTHASRSAHSMREKYRSAIYTSDPALAREARRLLASHEGVVTQVLPLRAFRPSREEILNYYAADPSRPFCQTYIEPKMELLRARFPQLLRRRPPDSVG